MVDSKVIFENVFNRPYNEHGNLDFLSGLVKEHPYFTTARFFLMTQLEKGAENFDREAGVTSCLFNNPLWLNFQLTRMKQPGHSTEVPGVVSSVAPARETEFQELPSQTEEALPASPLKDLDLSAPVKEDTLVFEPLHTTDYFASQGIRLTEEVKPDDKLGRQLKSFTEWLKTMKKIPPAGNPADLSSGGASLSPNESAIQNMAEKSNTEEEVLTETMADVLVQQGKTAKAIELYQKLSLLNPSKSAYFAAKIAGLTL